MLADLKLGLDNKTHNLPQQHNISDMFRRFYSPGTQIFSLLIAGVLSLIKAPKKTKRPARASARSPYYDAVQEVVAAHADCTAEVFNVFVSGAGKVRIFSELSPGDRVELHLREEGIGVFVDGKYMSTPLLPESSRLRDCLESDTEVKAFLGGRDVTSCSEDAEFCSIVAFYKIEGVPPTRISIK